MNFRKIIGVILLGIFFFICSFFMAEKTYAAISAVTFSGTSYSEVTTDNKKKVYAGLAGLATEGTCAGTLDNLTTCNSCSGTCTGDQCWQPCNENRIYDTLRFTIQFKTDSAALSTSNAVPLVKYSNGTSTVSIKYIESESSSQIKTGDTVTIKMYWKDVCAAVSGNSVTSCETLLASGKEIYNVEVSFGVDKDGSGTLTDQDKFYLTIRPLAATATYHSDVGTACSADSASDGSCFFVIYPGDQKVYLIDYKFASTYPATGNYEYQWMRLYYIEVNGNDDYSYFNNIKRNSPYQDFYVNKQSTTSFYTTEKKIGGLKNGQRYYFKLANVDKAKNVVNFSPQAPNSFWDYSLHAATPNEVSGLLEKNECFIATATYGSPNAPKVEDFRAFRNQYLLQTELGRKLVKFYYNNSPRFADIIRHNEPLRQLSSLGLWPIWAIAKLVLNYGLVFACFLFLLVFILPSVLLYFFFHKKKQPFNFQLNFKKVFSQITKTGIVFLLTLGLNPSSHAEDTETIETGDQAVNKSQVEEKIKHPLAKKGLRRIGKDGVYYYDTAPSPHNALISFRFGNMAAPKGANKDGTEYSNMYGGGGCPVMLFDYEWEYVSVLGRLGMKLGTGISMSTARGKIQINGTLQNSEERFTFYAIPNSLSLVYRFRFAENQWFVPHVEGGVDYLVYGEQRDDQKNKMTYGGAPGSHVAAGASFSITSLDRNSRAELDSEYGINSLWLTAEFRQQIAKNKTLDFTGNYVNVGITVEY